MFNRIRPFFRSLLRNSRKNEFDRSMNSELQFHIETRAEEFVRGGLSHEDALRRARVEFGGVENYSEAVPRIARSGAMAGDFRAGSAIWFAKLGKNPGFACVVILTLALGIGVNTAIFIAAQAVFLHSMPFPNAGRLTFISRVFPGSPVPRRKFFVSRLARHWRADKFVRCLRHFKTGVRSRLPMELSRCVWRPTTSRRGTSVC